MTLLTLAKAGDSAARRGSRAVIAWFPRPAASALIASAWFVLVFGAILWVWGLNPKALISPDEALNRFAAGVITKQWRPFLTLPFPDPEDLAHPRHWVSVGDHAIPSYAPVALYLYAFLLRFRLLGLLLVVAAPASAAAAYTLGIAKLLPPGRQWLSVVAPILGFPALYWLMRPWVNLSVLLVFVCWTFFFWASWRQSGNPRHLTAAIFGVGAAAAVRPDFAAYALLVALLFGVAANPLQWKRVVVLVLSAGASAVALNLFLNWVITGHPLLAAYQLLDSRDEDPSGPSGPNGPLRLLRQLLVPMGVPTRSLALESLGKYWLKMGPIAGLALGQLALIPILFVQPRLTRMLNILGLAVVLCFVLSHMNEQLNGASERLGMAHHSMPRYWSPVYLLAAVPPILFLGHCKKRALFSIGAVLICGFAVAGGYEICLRQTSSFVSLRKFARKYTQVALNLANKVPSDAIVYSATYDKVLWSRWRVGIIDEPEPTAASMSTAIGAGLDVFVYEPRFPRSRYYALSRALGRRHLSLLPVDKQGLLHVERRPDP